jgi:hypothetical protein
LVGRGIHFQAFCKKVAKAGAYSAKNAGCLPEIGDGGVIELGFHGRTFCQDRSGQPVSDCSNGLGKPAAE